MDNETLVFLAGAFATIIIIACALFFIFPPASAAQISVAYGDALNFSDSNAPYYIVIPSSSVIGDLSNLNTTASTAANDASANCQAWLFGSQKYIEPVPFTSHMSYYTVEIPADKIQSLPEGNYNMYLQFPGKTGVMSLQYNPTTKQIGSPFTNYMPISLVGLSSSLAEDAFVMAQDNTKDYGDTFYKVPVTIGRPSISVQNNYILSNGDLYIGGVTNLAEGDQISGTVDPDIYVSPEYHKMMTTITVAVGNDTNNRDWSMVFPQYLSDQLTVGHHEIAIDLGQGVTYTVPFSRWQDPVTPTPAPEIHNVYAVNGEWMGQIVNTTAPAPTPTPEPTINVTYETVLAKFRLNNRSIENRGDVYIGEKNLDVSRAVGWMQPNGAWVIQYCDYYGYNDWNKTITIPDPKHFDISKDVFQNDYGAWCQYSPTEAGAIHQPVAFFVKTDLPPTPTPTATPIENITVNVTPTEDVLNVTITPTPIANTPVPTPAMPVASDTIVVPLPWYLAVIAVAGVVGVVLWKK